MAPVAAGPSSTSHLRGETASGVAMSLIFWLCLLVAAGLFGLVSLAPKFSVYLHLRSQFDNNQRKLVALEEQAEQLGRVVHAIQNDPDFVAELTRIEFDAIGPDEEVIPVDEELQFDAAKVQTAVPELNVRPEWYEPYVLYLASNGNIRLVLLGAAAVLVIFSFTLLPPSGHGLETNRRSASLWQNLRNRYVRQT